MRKTNVHYKFTFFLLAVGILLSSFSLPVSGAIPPQERAALIALYNSTNGDNWTNKSGWKTPPLAGDGFALPGTENSWYGITCDPGNTTVQSISLVNNNLNGSLPLELGNLANLQILDLSLNQLSGSIPPELGNLANLQVLYLFENQLSGSIPPELGNLANLQWLFLDWNQLNGSIPSELRNLANLQYLGLSLNQFSGSIPPELGNLANLQILWLCFNQLSGSIPSELGNLANLQYLDLSLNLLSGSIPPELGNLANLQEIYLCYNQLSGSIPPELGNLANLRNLLLDYNQLIGSIPPELGNLANLQSLWLEWNQLSGSIPPELGNLANLQWLWLWDNQLSGSIPPELGNLANLQYLDLYNNQLSGSIPPELGNLANLQEIYLTSNQLSGSIPPELGNLANLLYLDLSNNQISGSISPELGNMSNLQELQIGANRLSGTIPSNLTNLTNLIDGYLDLKWNALYTNDDILRAFLNSKQCGGNWESTQTIAPSDVTAASVTTSSIDINWTPISYTFNSGGYRVFYSTTPGGPYTYFGITANKTVSSLTVTGLNPGTTYYFVVQTRTGPNAGNQNTVDSEYSTEISAATLEELSITVTAPNGGENWEATTSQTITWTSTGSIPNVKIEYSTDNGSSWNIIINSTTNTGSYNWIVPNTPSGNCLVKISDTAGPTSDTGNAVFTIAEQRTITVTSPNGGENLLANTTYAITWTNTGNIPNVKIEYSTNNGSSWSVIIASTTNSGSYDWTVPNTPSINCLVKVSDPSGPASAQSNAAFEITSVTYCASSGSSQTRGYISNVQVGSLNNPSGSSSYTDFTSLNANLTAGSSPIVYLTPSDTTYTKYWKIWIDYNRDGDFTDAGENVYSGSGKEAVSGDFTVPVSTIKGTTRMRVSMRSNNNPSFCSSFSYGEVEDYTANIQ